MSSSRAYQREVAACAASLGYTGERTASGHFRWTHPEVAHPIFTPGTPTTTKGNIERQKLKRALQQARAAAGKINSENSPPG